MTKDVILRKQDNTNSNVQNDGDKDEDDGRQFISNEEIVTEEEIENIIPQPDDFAQDLIVTEREIENIIPQPDDFARDVVYEKCEGSTDRIYHFIVC